VIAGATAVGGGLITLVVEFDVESEVLRDVESVTIGSAYEIDDNNVLHTKNKMVFLNNMVRSRLYQYLHKARKN
jgi:hypothetical protein